MAVSDWLRAGMALLYPPLCAMCGTPLARHADGLCVRCILQLPRTELHRVGDNRAERLFWGKVHVERATAFCYYHKGNDFAQILHRLKYGGRRDLGRMMGRLMAAELRDTSLIKDADLIVPVPLHAKKERTRGYNQSEMLAIGMSQVSGLPVVKEGVVRMRHTDTQTRKSVLERWENVENVFMVRKPELFRGKHILLLDDVLTTGATCAACAAALLQVQGVKVSILTLAMADDK